MKILFVPKYHNQAILVWKGFQALTDLFQRNNGSVDVYAQAVGQHGTGYLLLQGNGNTPGALDGSAVSWAEVVGPDVKLVNGVPKWIAPLPLPAGEAIGEEVP